MASSLPPTTMDLQSYTELKPGKALSEFVDQNVCIRAKSAVVIHQHLMKSKASPTELHTYLDLADGPQIVAYHEGLNLPSDDREHRYYGRIGSVQGLRKNPNGETYQEHYLLLHKVD